MEEYQFNEEDIQRFSSLGLDVQAALDAGSTPQSISNAAISIEEDQQFESQQAPLVPQQSNPQTATIPLTAPRLTGRAEGESFAMDKASEFSSSLQRNIAGVLGFGLRKFGEYIGSENVAIVGDVFKDSFNQGAQISQQNVSPFGQQEAAQNLFSEKPGEIFGPGATNLQTLSSVLANAAGSTALPLGLGSVAARTLASVGLPAVVAGGLGVGGASGLTEGLNTASDVFDDANNTTDEEVFNSKLYNEYEAIIKTQFPQAQRSDVISFVRKSVSKDISSDLGLAAGAIIGLTSIPIGGFLGKLGFAGQSAKGVAKKGFFKSVLQGGVLEGFQEGGQEFSQQLLQNYGNFVAGKNIEPYAGVGEASFRGIAGGIGTGGPVAGLTSLGTPSDAVADDAVAPDLTPDEGDADFIGPVRPDNITDEDGGTADLIAKDNNANDPPPPAGGAGQQVNKAQGFIGPLQPRLGPDLGDKVRLQGDLAKRGFDSSNNEFGNKEDTLSRELTDEEIDAIIDHESLDEHVSRKSDKADRLGLKGIRIDDERLDSIFSRKSDKADELFLAYAVEERRASKFIGPKQPTTKPPTKPRDNNDPPPPTGGAGQQVAIGPIEGALPSQSEPEKKKITEDDVRVSIRENRLRVGTASLIQREELAREVERLEAITRRSKQEQATLKTLKRRSNEEEGLDELGFADQKKVVRQAKKDLTRKQTRILSALSGKITVNGVGELLEDERTRADTLVALAFQRMDGRVTGQSPAPDTSGKLRENDPAFIGPVKPVTTTRLPDQRTDGALQRTKKEHADILKEDIGKLQTVITNRAKNLQKQLDQSFAVLDNRLNSKKIADLEAEIVGETGPNKMSPQKQAKLKALKANNLTKPEIMERKATLEAAKSAALAKTTRLQKDKIKARTQRFHNEMKVLGIPSSDVVVEIDESDDAVDISFKQEDAKEAMRQLTNEVKGQYEDGQFIGEAGRRVRNGQLEVVDDSEEQGGTDQELTTEELAELNQDEQDLLAIENDDTAIDENKRLNFLETKRRENRADDTLRSRGNDFKRERIQELEDKTNQDLTPKEVTDRKVLEKEKATLEAKGEKLSPQKEARLQKLSAKKLRTNEEQEELERLTSELIPVGEAQFPPGRRSVETRLSLTHQRRKAPKRAYYRFVVTGEKVVAKRVERPSLEITSDVKPSKALTDPAYTPKRNVFVGAHKDAAGQRDAIGRFKTGLISRDLRSIGMNQSGNKDPNIGSIGDSRKRNVQRNTGRGINNAVIRAQELELESTGQIRVALEGEVGSSRFLTIIVDDGSTQGEVIGDMELKHGIPISTHFYPAAKTRRGLGTKEIARIVGTVVGVDLIAKVDANKGFNVKGEDFLTGYKRIKRGLTEGEQLGFSKVDTLNQHRKEWESVQDEAKRVAKDPEMTEETANELAKKKTVERKEIKAAKAKAPEQVTVVDETATGEEVAADDFLAEADDNISEIQQIMAAEAAVAAEFEAENIDDPDLQVDETTEEEKAALYQYNTSEGMLNEEAEGNTDNQISDDLKVCKTRIDY